MVKAFGFVVFRFSLIALGMSIGVPSSKAQTKVAPEQIHGSSVVVMQCAGATSPSSDCTGMLYVDVTRADGSHVKAVGTPPPDGFVIDPARWSVLP